MKQASQGLFPHRATLLWRNTVHSDAKDVLSAQKCIATHTLYTIVTETDFVFCNLHQYISLFENAYRQWRRKKLFSINTNFHGDYVINLAVSIRCGYCDLKSVTDQTESRNFQGRNPPIAIHRGRQNVANVSCVDEGRLDILPPDHFRCVAGVGGGFTCSNLPCSLPSTVATKDC